MLKAPFSLESIKSGKLSEREKELLEQNILTETDLEITKFLYENNPHANAEFVKSINEGTNLLTLLIKGNESEFIGKEGEIVNSLSQMLKKKVRIVSLPERAEMAISNLYSIRIKKVTESYLPNQPPIKKVYIEKPKNQEILEKIENISNLLTYLYKMKTEIIIE